MDGNPKTVVFFGDSLTRADYLPQGFVSMLAERHPQVRVVNAGANGDTSADLLGRVDRVQALGPDRVYLAVGTNDCGWGTDPAQYGANLCALVSALRPAEIVLITPTTSSFFVGGNAPYVAAAREVAEREGLPLVDFAAVVQESDFDLDGLHWNEQGHARLAEMIARESPL